MTSREDHLKELYLKIKKRLVESLESEMLEKYIDINSIKSMSRRQNNEAGIVPTSASSDVLTTGTSKQRVYKKG